MFGQEKIFLLVVHTDDTRFIGDPAGGMYFAVRIGSDWHLDAHDIVRPLHHLHQANIDPVRIAVAQLGISTAPLQGIPVQKSRIYQDLYMHGTAGRRNAQFFCHIRNAHLLAGAKAQNPDPPIRGQRFPDRRQLLFLCEIQSNCSCQRLRSLKPRFMQPEIVLILFSFVQKYHAAAFHTSISVLQIPYVDIIPRVQEIPCIIP